MSDVLVKGYNSLADYMAEIFPASYTSITSLVPNLYLFTDGLTGTNIPDGGDDMYDNGNVLNTNIATLIPYTNNAAQSGSNYFGLGSRYATLKQNGIFVLVADRATISSFYTTGDNGADGNGSVDSTILSTTSGGQTYYLYIKRIFQAGNDPSINQIIITTEGSLSHSVAGNTGDGMQTVSGFNASIARQVHYILVARRSGSSGLKLENSDAINVADAYLRLIP